MKIFYWIMCILALIGCAVSLKNGEAMAALDKLTISMLWFIIIKHNEWVDELKDCIDILIDRLNDTIEEAEKEIFKESGYEHTNE